MNKQLAIEKWKNKKFKGDNFHTWIYDQTFPSPDLKRLGKPFSMVALEINSNEFIVMGVDNDSQTPNDFLANNKFDYFTLDNEKKSCKIKSQIGYVVVHYSRRITNIEIDLIEISLKSDIPIVKLDFAFQSPDHIRYENGNQVSGPHGGAPRLIKAETHPKDSSCYIITILNTEGQTEVVQMAPKIMKIQRSTSEFIELRGYEHDMFGESFENYGLTIYHENGVIIKCILHLHDRMIDIEYLSIQPKLRNEGNLKTWFRKYFNFS